MPDQEPDRVRPVPSPSRPRNHARKSGFRKGQLRRGVYGLAVIIVVLVIGTVGLHAIAGSTWVDSFYFESMLATGQGPPFPLTTDAAKLFASAMAFISVGSVVSVILLTLGPIVVQLWREGVERVEEEARELEHEVLGGGRRP